MEDRSHWAQRFHALVASGEFLPNSPTLMNAGTGLGQLSACFVLPVEDTIESHLRGAEADGARAAHRRRHRILVLAPRPRGDVVASTGGEAGALANFSLSVSVTDGFMQAAAANARFELIHPRTGKAVARVPSAEIFGAMAEAAWRGGDPGLLFRDAINGANPTPGLGAFEATNPCGEVPLLAYESCNLGSINLIVAEAVRFALRSRGMQAMKRSLRERLRRLGRA